MASLVRRAGWAAIAVLLVSLVWTAAVLLVVRGDLTDARRQLNAAADADEVDAARTPLARAQRELEQAQSRLGHPGPRLVAAIPVVGRPLDALRLTTDAGRAVVTGGGELLEALPEQLMSDGRVDVAGLQRVAAAADRAAARAEGPVDRLEDVQLSLVPDVVAEPVRGAREELLGAPDTLSRTARALTGMTGLLGSSPRRPVLVMLQNNAELRGTGGLVTVFAQALVGDGRLEIASFRDVEDVADSTAQARRVPAPPDYTALWGPFLANSTLWLNVNMTPDVPTASTVLADVAVASGLPRPEAVLWFDVRAIAAVLEATGPVRLPDGTRLTAGNAVRVLLSDAYKQAVDTREGQAARRAALRGAADAVLGRLFATDGKQVSPVRLGEALAQAAAGRHVTLWSAEPEEQRNLLAGGVAGAVTAAGGDLSAVALQNFGGGNRQGNKLDYYARRQVTVRVSVGPDEAVVEQELALRNTAPARGLPTYVAGQVDPGTTRNYVALALPRDAREVTLTRGGEPVPATPTPSGDHQVVTDAALLGPGSQTSWLLRYRMPVRNGRYDLRLVPQPLAVDAGLRVELVAGDGRRLHGRDVRGGVVLLSGPYDAERAVSVQALRPGVVRRAADRVRRFWQEPVRVPWGDAAG